MDHQARIIDEARRAGASPFPQVRPAEETPALAGLLTAARSAIEESLPRFIEHAGLRYRVRLQGFVKVAVCKPGASDEPLFLGGLMFDTTGF